MRAISNSNYTPVSVMRERAEHEPDVTAYTLYNNASGPSFTVTFGALDARARALAAVLQQRPLRGERALHIYPPSPENIAAFFGCLYAGVLPVPCLSPSPFKRERAVSRLRHIVADCQPRLVLTERVLESEVRKGCAGLDVEIIVTDVLAPDGDAFRPITIDRQDSAYIQYTSGSTGAPKGVLLSHANLVAQCEHLRSFSSPGGVHLTCSPLSHDLGLVSGIVGPPVVGAHSVLLSPISVLKSPLSWLRVISREKVTHSGAQNYLYELCASRYDEQQCRDLDLQSWERAYNGSEVVRAKTLELFTGCFARHGFRANAHSPAYGLAEATLQVSGYPAGKEATVLALDRKELALGRVVERSADHPAAKQVVGCGLVLPGRRIAIVDPQTRRAVAPGNTGEIWVQGGDVALGYWGRPEESECMFRARRADADDGTYLRTGDLGFVRGDELFFAARLKDLIVLWGINFNPDDVERTAEAASPWVRAGNVVAFSTFEHDHEDLVLVAEVRDGRYAAGELEEHALTIAHAIYKEFYAPVTGFFFVRPGSLPKTTSGKIQRSLCRKQLLNGELPIVGRATHQHIVAAWDRLNRAQPN